MGEQTGIQWTDRTFNPWRGCTKVSPGCKNCYMFTEQTRYGQDPGVVTRTKTWRDPHKWQKEAAAANRFDRVFTCSWSDWFHKDADPWRDEAWALVRSCPNLIFQILTKRPERILDHLPRDWHDGYPNVWLGVSAEDQAHYNKRYSLLAYIPARVRFISAEPLIGGINFNVSSLKGIHWVIFGGESGPGARECNAGWIMLGVVQCQEAGVAAFVKQLGARPIGLLPEAKAKIKHHKGGDIGEWPESFRVRQFPA